MEEFIAYLIKNLVEFPEEVKISTRQGDAGIVLEVRAAQKDVARVIGRGGRTINAIRTIASTAAARHGARVRVEVIEDRPE